MLPWGLRPLLVAVVLAAGINQLQLPRRSHARALEVPLGFRGEESRPDMLAGLTTVRVVRARAPRLDRIPLAGKLDAIRLASPDDRLDAPRASNLDRHPPREEVTAAAIADRLRNQRCQVR